MVERQKEIRVVDYDRILGILMKETDYDHILSILKKMAEVDKTAREVYQLVLFAVCFPHLWNER